MCDHLPDYLLDASMPSDYIFHGLGLKATSCKRIGMEPNAVGVYPSDHVGLVAEFMVDS